MTTITTSRPRCEACANHDPRDRRDHGHLRPDMYPAVLDDSRRNDLPTGRVTVTAPEGFTDRDLAHAAGFNSSHHGVDVTRYDDGTALVSLWND